MRHQVIIRDHDPLVGTELFEDFKKPPAKFSDVMVLNRTLNGIITPVINYNYTTCLYVDLEISQL